MLANWRRERLKHTIELLGDTQQSVVEAEIERLAGFRGWHVWTKNARTNHVHVVVTASGYAGKTVRDQLKANCPGALRRQRTPLVLQRTWTKGGDCEILNTDDDIEAAVMYTTDAQETRRAHDRCRPRRRDPNSHDADDTHVPGRRGTAA